MSETKLGPRGEVIDQDGEVVGYTRGWRRWWAATEGIRFITLCWVIVLVGMVLMARIHG